jgi:hypothetical protein
MEIADCAVYTGVPYVKIVRSEPGINVSALDIGSVYGDVGTCSTILGTL